jgi:hypothetical protein
MTNCDSRCSSVRFSAGTGWRSTLEIGLLRGRAVCALLNEAKQVQKIRAAIAWRVAEAVIQALWRADGSATPALERSSSEAACVFQSSANRFHPACNCLYCARLQASCARRSFFGANCRLTGASWGVHILGGRTRIAARIVWALGKRSAAGPGPMLWSASSDLGCCDGSRHDRLCVAIGSRGFAAALPC